MAGIFEQRNSIRVLHFEKIELLDRRLLAVILRGCPKVTMLGIYNCPLINFGDVICLLDLIGQVNKARDAEGHPRVKAFDFFPSMNPECPLTIRRRLRTVCVGIYRSSRLYRKVCTQSFSRPL